VRAFTDRYLHLGSRSTSRGQGNHFCVKRYISFARCDLLRVFQNISLMLETQFTELQKHIEDEKIKTSHRHSNNIFKNLSRKVSQYAMNKILEQFKFIAVKDDPCSGCFTTSFGLPCSHKLLSYVQSNEPIPLDMINPQWILSVDENIENDTLVISQQMMELSPVVLLLLCERLWNKFQYISNFKNTIKGLILLSKRKEDRSVQKQKYQM
jgi:hypothetical protein